MQTPTPNRNPADLALATALAKLLPAVQEIIVEAAGTAAHEAGQGTDMFLIDQFADEAVGLLAALLAESRASQITAEHAATFWKLH